MLLMLPTTMMMMVWWTQLPICDLQLAHPWLLSNAVLYARREAHVHGLRKRLSGHFREVAAITYRPHQQAAPTHRCLHSTSVTLSNGVPRSPEHSVYIPSSTWQKYLHCAHANYALIRHSSNIHSHDYSCLSSLNIVLDVMCWYCRMLRSITWDCFV